MIPPGDSSELSPGNNYPTEVIIIDWFQKTLYTQVKIATSSFLFCFTPIADEESSCFLGTFTYFLFFTQIVIFIFQAF